MRVKLARNQYEYLRDYIQKEKKLLLDIYQNEIDDKSVSLDIQNGVADEIRDWAIERQQKAGFDSNYKLTSEGKILEEIIDLFLSVKNKPTVGFKEPLAKAQLGFAGV